MTPIPVLGSPDIATVETLARAIWTEHYTPIIGRAQVDYMLDKIQSAAVIATQIGEGLEYFLIPCDGVPVGYFAIRGESQERRMFLSKLYVSRSTRGRGLGAAAVRHIEFLARERGFALVRLTVNKHNPALHAYQRMGFVIVADVVTDIGDGYVMDDYSLEKPV